MFKCLLSILDGALFDLKFFQFGMDFAIIIV
jgi:hypothetical protein